MDYVVIGFEIVVGMILGVLFLQGCAIIFTILGLLISEFISNWGFKKREKLRSKNKKKKIN